MFLIRRTKARHGAPDFLPCLIHAMIDELCGVLNNHSPWPREDLTTEVIDTILVRCPNAVNLAIAPTATQIKDQTDKGGSCALGFALYQEKEEVVSALLDSGVDPWDGNSLFRSSFFVATKVNNASLVKRLLSASDNHDIGHGAPSEKRNRLQYRTIMNCIDQATQRRGEGVALALLAWFAERVPKSVTLNIRFWIQLATRAGNLDFLKEVHELGHAKKSGKYTRFIVDGLAESAQPEPILRFCLDNDLISKLESVSIEGEYILDVAVECNSLPLAQAAFAVNAYADTSAALRAAIRSHALPMVQLLLAHGVDPEAPMDPPVGMSTCELAEPHSALYWELHRAISRKMSALGAMYTPPFHLVRDCKTKKHVLVPYTFHAP